MTDLTKVEVERAIQRMKRSDWSQDDRDMLLRLEPNERDMILLLAGELDAHPVSDHPHSADALVIEVDCRPPKESPDPPESYDPATSPIPF